MTSGFEARTVASGRFEQLLELTERLSGLTTPGAVASHAADFLREALQAAGVLMVYRETWPWLRKRLGALHAVSVAPAGLSDAEGWRREAYAAARWALDATEPVALVPGEAPDWPEVIEVTLLGTGHGWPLRVGDRTLGALWIDWGPVAPDGEQMMALAGFARAIGQTLDAALVCHDMQDRLSGLEMLSQLFASVARNLDLDRVLDMALQMAMDLTKAERALVLLLDGDQLRLALGRDQSGLLDAGAEATVSRSICQQAIETRQGVFVFNTGAYDGLEERYSVRDLRLKAVVTVPLIGQTGVIGVLYVDSRTAMHQALEQEMSVLTAIAGQAGILIENARLFRQATVDGLTGLYLRSYFMNRLEDETRRVLRYGGVCSLLVIDVDHFKRVNDTHGHQTGDIALQAVSRLVVRGLRTGIDLSGRYGGEEVVVLLPETDAAGALVAAERMRQRIEEAELKTVRGEPLRVTVSIGIASLPEMAGSAAELFARADEALYASKQGGRNRVTVYGAP